MKLRAVKDPTQVATRCWVAVDTERNAQPGDPYSVGGHPMVELYDVSTLWSEKHKAYVPTQHGRIFWARKRDVQVAIDKVTPKVP